MTPEQLLSEFSPTVTRKGESLAHSSEHLVIPDEDVYPQLWHVQGSGKVYQVQVVCGPLDGSTASLDVHGMSCDCPNGRNTPLGRARCYHAASVLVTLAG